MDGGWWWWVLAWQPTGGGGAGAKFISHLIQEALHEDNQRECDRVQAEEDVITLHGVHSVWVFEEKLLLSGVWREAEG